MSGPSSSVPPASSWPEAATILADRDPVIGRLVTETGLPEQRPPTESHYAALVRAIVYQQLAGSAAAAIHGRLAAALDGDVTPDKLVRLPPEALRSAGLSGRKAETLRDLAAKVLDGTVVLASPGLKAKSDDAVIASLTP